jgi:hypothetical protein
MLPQFTAMRQPHAADRAMSTTIEGATGLHPSQAAP